jgi:hypothetical protein
VRRLGAPGMSSEESDADPTLHRHIMYRKRMPWRRDMESLLELVDAYRIEEGSGFSRQGTEPALRMQGNTVSTRAAPSRLPRVLYDPNWLQQHNRSYIKHIIQPRDSIDYRWVEVMPFNARTR